MCILIGMQDESTQKKCLSVDSSNAVLDNKRLDTLKPALKKRAAIISSIRRFFEDTGFLEVETPLRISSPAPELHIDTEESLDRFLIASPELQMKRLLAAGYDRIFEICRCFRKGERGQNHLPEFSMLEWYRLGGGMDDLMNDCEALLRCAAIGGGVIGSVIRNGHSIDLNAPFYRIEVADAFERFAKWRPSGAPDPERFDRDLVEKVEPNLPVDRPVFLVGYPATMASLARLDPKNPERALRFELYAGGLELANGFCELTDAKEQRRRFETEEQERRSAGKPPYSLDERFLGALSLGLKDCAGIALGVDRLIMLLLCANAIDDVTAFPEGTF
jgi:lysyl-tRNA synthetase class 2